MACDPEVSGGVYSDAPSRRRVELEYCYFRFKVCCPAPTAIFLREVGNVLFPADPGVGEEGVRLFTSGLTVIHVIHF